MINHSRPKKLDTQAVKTDTEINPVWAAKNPAEYHDLLANALAEALALRRRIRIDRDDHAAYLIVWDPEASRGGLEL